MSGSNFTRKYTISKQSGPVYINSYALSQIGLKYQNPTNGLDPVSLPMGWVLPRLEDTYRVNFSQEYAVLEQAKARRQAIVGEAPDPNSSLRANALNPVSLAGGVPLIPYQSSTILTPIPVSTETVTTTESGSSDTTVTKPLGEMSLRDFEGDSSDPFESTALQAIDVFSELQSVLQPELNNTAQLPGQNPRALPTTSSHGSHSPNNLSTTSPYSFNTQTATQPPVYSSSVPTGSDNIPQPRNNIRPPPGGVGVLVDFGRHDQATNDTHPLVTAGQNPSSSSHQHGLSFLPPNKLTPPPVQPKPVRFQLPPVSMATNPSHPPYPGVQVLPVNNPETRPPPYTETYAPPYQEDEQLYTTASASFNAHFNPPNPQFELPNIQNSLSDEEKENLLSISGMGFPVPRVARALKHFNDDNQAVLDFLFLVGELEDKGYHGDSAEAALMTHDKDIPKSIDYLKQVAQYKEMWSEESIHNAYQESGKDWEKTIDILTQ